MKKVLVGGVFDILHPGHLWVIQQARKYGDYIVVVVAQDSFAKKLKNRQPVVPGRQRLEMVAGLKGVDQAILGDEHDFTKTVDKVRPDVVVLGFDQQLDERVVSYLGEKGIELVKLKEKLNGELLNSSKIIAKIKSS